MQELWSSASYEPHLWSVPFAFAPAAMLICVAYGLAMRGEPILRAWMLLHFLALLPYSVTMTLSPSIVSQPAAEAMFRIAAACIPLAAAAGAGFQFRLLGKHRQARWFVWLGVAIASAWVIAGALTDAAVVGVRWLPAGLWYPNAGPYAWLALLSTVVVATPGFLVLARAAFTMKPGPARRQLRLVLVANAITYSGLIDVGLAYHIGVFPLGWVLSGAGSALVARALVAEDLLRARAVDTTVPRAVLHFASALLVGGVALRLLGTDAPWWMETLAIALSFVSVRVTIAVIGLVLRGTRRADSTLDRLLAQLVARARPLENEGAVAALAVDVIELAVGERVSVLLAAADDYGWSTTGGVRLADDVAPDPLVGAWLAERHGPVFADDDEVPAELREPLAVLLERQRARAAVPVASGDDLLALVLLPAGSQRLRGRERAFLVSACERLGEAILHARMARHAAERAMIARQVELAATLQGQLLPGAGPHVHGNVTVVGSWLPATRCAGDYWGVYPLGEGRTLVAVGDVTGHGVASATVTAAAASAVEVVVRRRGEALELGELAIAIDASVRRVGGGQLTMTCFAAILDRTLDQIHFVSCGHPTPYLCRALESGDIDRSGSAGPRSAAEGRRGESIELQALVARGNPLGMGSSAPKVLHKPLRAGDLVVWYTDGVIEAQDPSGEPFGDRRLQRLLRKLDRTGLGAVAVHDLIYSGIAAHRAGTPRVDDETLVVAEVKP